MLPNSLLDLNRKGIAAELEFFQLAAGLWLGAHPVSRCSHSAQAPPAASSAVTQRFARYQPGSGDERLRRLANRAAWAYRG